MRYFLKIYIMMAMMIVLSLSFTFAQAQSSTCSPNGYTVVTINGVFTDESEAILNRDALKYYFETNYNHQPLTIDYLHNESHLGGIGDIAKVVYQKIFDNETVEDYDLIEMLKSASEKVKTQKILLVAHSQGNFYANSFYDTVSGKEGGVPSESIGVYSVATPAGRVAGGGRWLTSDTDKIIADMVGRMPFKKIMPPNTSIVLTGGDDTNGHNFSGVYLKYRSKEIVGDIKNSLDKLKINSAKDPQVSCIEPPKLTLAHKMTGVVFAVADPVAETGISVAVFAGTAATTAVKTVTQVAVTTASSITATAKSIVNEMANLTGNNSAAVSVATQKTQISTVNSVVANKQNVSVSALATNRQTIAKSSVLSTVINTASASEPSEKLITMSDKSPPPKLVFVGLRMLGGGASSQVAPQKVEDVEIESETEEELSVPTLNITQCDISLATDGCLLATTTINFSWTAVSGADYYAMNKNGEYSTTTELSFSATIADFSDYIFAVSAISSATTSATSTKTVSVATIPIAINEIAWMGTRASSFDEWLELKNNTGHTIDLSQWVLGSLDNAPYIILSGSIAPHEYRILERRENTIVVNSEVLVYGNGSSEWALGNVGGEELVLSRASTTLDKTPAITGGNWTAGDNSATTSRKTMERIDSKQSGATTTSWATWGTNANFIKIGLDADGNQILGTPGECNSASFININGGQDIASSTTLEANNCYYVSAGVEVSASSTLTIEEGVRVSLSQNSLYVDGVLDVNGAENNPVVFDSFFSEATTNKIQISGNSGTSTINNTVISDTGGVSLNSGADVEITNTDFANNNYSIQLYSGSSAVIENVNFASTTREAISAYSGSIVEVASSTIINTINAEAIGVYDSNLSVSSTTIDIVYDGDGVGAYDSTVSLASSTISNVLSGDGIGAYDSTMTVVNVVVENTSGDGIAVYGGSISGNATIDGAEVEY